MELHESGEMYLETILLLKQKRQSVRSIDISEFMGFSKPSVSRAISLLKKSGYIVLDEKGFISLTTEGESIAQKIYERHIILSRFFELIGVSKDVSNSDACKIEHHISDETFDAIKKHVCTYACKDCD